MIATANPRRSDGINGSDLCEPFNVGPPMLSSGLDHEDDPGHHERDPDDQHRPGELVSPPWGVMDQTPPARRPEIMASANWIVHPFDAVKTAANSHDRQEQQHQGAQDRQHGTDHPSPHAVPFSTTRIQRDIRSNSAPPLTQRRALHRPDADGMITRPMGTFVRE